MGNDNFDNWLDFIADETTDDEAERKVQKLVNVLAKYDGDRGEKLIWLRRSLSLLECEAGKLFDPTAEPQKYAASILSLTIRFYRHYLKSHAREMPQDKTGVRSTQPAKPRYASGSDFLREVK